MDLGPFNKMGSSYIKRSFIVQCEITVITVTHNSKHSEHNHFQSILFVHWLRPPKENKIFSKWDEGAYIQGQNHPQPSRPGKVK